MELFHSVEKQLGELFARFPSLPKDAKASVVKLLPWLTLLTAFIQLYTMFSLYRWANAVNNLSPWAREFSTALGYSDGFTIWIWIAILLLLTQIVLLSMAYGRLTRKKFSGWQLLTLAALIHIVYGLTCLFIQESKGGIDICIIAGVSSFVSLYFLFQVRDKFGGKSL